MLYCFSLKFHVSHFLERIVMCSLLSERVKAERSRCLAQVLNQTSRLEIQLLENSLSTNKLEKQLMLQTNEISKLHDKNG